MLRFRVLALWVGLMSLFVAGFVAAQQTAQALLDQAQAKKASGDLQAASEGFETIVSKFATTDRSATAKALLGLGEIFDSLGQAARARTYFDRVRGEFKDQTVEARIATERIAPTNRPAPTKVSIKTPYAEDVYSFAISPDGKTLVFQGTSADGRKQLWRQPVDASAKPEPIAGTEGSGLNSLPFFSPDGKQIAFFHRQKLLLVDLAGGTPKELVDAPLPWGAAWVGNTIVMSGYGPGGPVHALENGRLRPLTTTPGVYMTPKVMDTQRYLYFTLDFRGGGQFTAGALDGAPTQARGLPDAHAGAFTQGYLVYVTKAGTLNALRFDPQNLASNGSSSQIADRIGKEDRYPGVAAVAVSESGAVAFRESAVAKRQMMWMDRTGALVGVVGGPDASTPSAPKLSSDGRTVLFFRQLGTALGSMWTIGSDGTALQQLQDGTNAGAWSPNGDKIMLAALRSGQSPGPLLFERPATNIGGATGIAPNISVINAPRGAAVPRGGAGPRGAANGRQVGPTVGIAVPDDWNANGNLVFRTGNSTRTGYGGDLFVLAPDQTTVTPVANTPAAEREGRFSPDGNWIVYQSDETGRWEIYVQPFPGTTTQRQRVSLGGGTSPRWGRKGRELYFLGQDSRMMVASAETATTGGKPSITFGTPKALFRDPLPAGSEFDVAQDGDRFLVLAPLEDTPPIVVLSNWMPAR